MMRCMLFLAVAQTLSDELFNPDPGVPPVLPRQGGGRIEVKPFVRESPRLDPAFNPDPGVPPVIRLPVLRQEFGLPRETHFTNVPPAPAILRRIDQTYTETSPPEIEPPPAPPASVVFNPPLPASFPIPEYPLSASGQLAPNTQARTNRWKIELEPWQRYTSGQAETPYQSAGPALWHPYRQSVLKGDVPIFRQDIFLNLSASFQSELEFRRLPITDSHEWFSQNYAGFSADLYQGETVFRPARWRFNLRPVFNVNHLESREMTRTRADAALQEVYAEAALAELSDNYDLLAVRVGNQTFNSDFRGFIFNDVNSGLRVFGNADNNRWQYNLALFDMREKDRFSELNTFDQRDQRVIAANVYRQDTIWDGYTAQLSFHANFDDSASDSVHAYYFGWAGDGHIGRFNITHAFYQAIGDDEINLVDINARMAALELSVDDDWLRYKGSFFYASGDEDPADGTGGGFDAILDSSHFAGAPFSAFARQSFGLRDGGPGLKGRNSLLPSLRTSKLQGQANFMNPGIFLFGLGTEARLTPKVRAFAHANYIRFAETASLEGLRENTSISRDLGVDLSVGVQYRPLLINNIVINGGLGAMIPANGYHDLYPDSPFPYSALLTVALTY